MSMRKERNHWFWNAKGRLEVWKTIFFMFSNEKKVASMYKISCLHPKSWYTKDSSIPKGFNNKPRQKIEREHCHVA